MKYVILIHSNPDPWGHPTSLYTDSQVTNGNCYKYRYVVTDQLGNQTIATTTNVAKVDYRGAVAATAGLLSQLQPEFDQLDFLQVRGFDTDAVARFLLTETEARDLEIAARGIEEAFLTLTGDHASTDDTEGTDR